MKNKISSSIVRKIFNIFLLAIWLGFFGFGIFLYLSFGNAMSDTPKTGETKNLLSDFRDVKFEDAIERLQKRRELINSQTISKDPFGQIEN